MNDVATKPDVNKAQAKRKVAKKQPLVLSQQDRTEMPARFMKQVNLLAAFLDQQDVDYRAIGRVCRIMARNAWAMARR